MSVQEIEAAITQLPPNDLVELLAWLTDYQARAWDEQIKQDLESGRLDALLAQVDKEYEAGLGQPIGESKREQKIRTMTEEVFKRRQSAYQRLAEGAS